MVVISARDEDTLALLGLSDYEARAYRALLSEHPATAYRIAQRSGVPQSKVYETLARLVRKGAASLCPGRPTRYAPVPPDDLIAAARARTARRFEALAADLRQAYAGTEAVPHAYVRGEAGVIKQATDLAIGADDLLIAAGSAETLDAVCSAIATDRARLRTVSLPGSRQDRHALLILANGSRALIGRLGPEADALVTDHPVITSLLADYLMHRAVADNAQDLAAARPRTAEIPRRSDWQAWEQSKARRLLSVH